MPTELARGPAEPLLLLLAVVAGGIDAVSYLDLKKVFPANMTGNTVLLGLGVATGHGSDAARGAVALAGFVAGAVVAGVVTPTNRWTARTTGMLAAETAILAALAALRIAHSTPPVGGYRYLLIGLAGLAMGGQSGAIRRLGIGGVNTTFITGTWTAIATHIGARLRPAAESTSGGRVFRLQVGLVVVYFCGGIAAAGAYTAWPRYAFLIPLVVLAVVVMLAGRVARKHEEPSRREALR